MKHIYLGKRGTNELLEGEDIIKHIRTQRLNRTGHVAERADLRRRCLKSTSDALGEEDDQERDERSALNTTYGSGGDRWIKLRLILSCNAIRRIYLGKV